MPPAAVDRWIPGLRLTAHPGMTRNLPDRCHPPMKNTAVIGAGPAGLIAAEVLAQGGAARHRLRRDAVGRPQIPDGRPWRAQPHAQRTASRLPRPLPRGDAASRARPSKRFRHRRLRDWSEALGQETFVGSSGRVFPKAFKASPLLRAWLRRLDSMGVKLALRHRWTGWDEQGRFAFKRRMDRAPSRPAPRCWRSAAQAGRGSARTVRGRRSSRPRA